MEMFKANTRELQNFLEAISLNKFINEVELIVDEEVVTANGKDFAGMLYFFLKLKPTKVLNLGSILIKDLERIIKVVKTFKDEEIIVIHKANRLKIKGKKTTTISLLEDKDNDHALSEGVVFNADSKEFVIKNDDDKYETKFVNFYDVSNLDFKEAIDSYNLISFSNFSKPNFVFIQNFLLVVNEDTNESVKIDLGISFKNQIIIDSNIVFNLLKTNPAKLIIGSNKDNTTFLIEVGDDKNYIVRSQEIGENEVGFLPF